MRDWWNYHSDGRISGVALRGVGLLAICIAIAVSSILAHFGTVSIFYDSSTGSVGYILTCPEPSMMVDKRNMDTMTDYCEVTAYDWNLVSISMIANAGRRGDDYECIVPSLEFKNMDDMIDQFPAVAARDPIKCRIHRPCSTVRYCTESGIVVDCPRGFEEAFEPANIPDWSIYVSLDPDEETGFYMPWDSYARVSFRQYCDSSYLVRPGKVIAARGIIGGFLLLTLLWVIFDLLITLLVVRRSIKSEMKRLETHQLNIPFLSEKTLSTYNRIIETTTGIATPETSALPTPCATPASSLREGMVSRIVRQETPVDHVVSPSRSFKVAVCRDPIRAYSSFHWMLKVRAYVSCRPVSVFRYLNPVMVNSLEVVFSVLLFGFLICLGLLAISPTDLVHDSFSVADTFFRNYSTIWKAKSTWVILPFLLLDELVELLLFFVEATTVRLNGQSTTLFAKVTKDLRTVVVDDDFDEFDFASDSSDACKVVSEHLVPECIAAVVCIDQFRRVDDEIFIKNVQSVIEVVGIERTFILQFGPELVPMDDSLVLLQERVSAGIQYVFVPEPQKTVATYWFSKYHIPLVQLHSTHPTPISHLMVIDHSVHVPWNLAIPLDFVDPVEKVAVICIGSVLPGAFDEIDYKTEQVHSQFQSDRSSLGDSQLVDTSGICVWDRSALEVSSLNSNADFASLGFVAVNLHRGRIKFVQNAWVVNHTWDSSFSSMRGLADKLYLNFASRKRLIVQDLKTSLSPYSWLSLSRLAAKPMSFIHLFNHILDVIRYPVLIASVLRDPVGLGFIVGLYLVLLWVKMIVMALVAKENRSGFFSSLVWPGVHFIVNLLVLRPLSIVAGMFWTLRDRPVSSIQDREDQEGSIPPCLPFTDAHWFSVWNQPINVKNS